MEYGLIGEHLSHSFSPEIHASFASYDYRLCELEPDSVQPFLQRRDFKGINVTIPYKEKVMPYLDYIDESAKSIGSVNTIVNKNGLLYGYNTDYYGFSYMLKKGNIDVSGKTVAILGNGGATKTVIAVTHDLGAKEILVVSRRGDINYETVREYKDIQVIINCSPVGMYPKVGECLVSLDDFPRLEAVADLVYNPYLTELLFRAKEKGLNYINGLSMLVAQAKMAVELFLNAEISEQEIDKVERKVRAMTNNITFVGMPGCGKSTVASALSELMSKEACDTDAEFEKTYGISPSKCITEQGEQSFRDKESEVIKRVLTQSKRIVSTGGGAVIRAQNRKFITSNSIVVWLKRDVNGLSTKDRPLSKSVEELKKLYEFRAPLYEEVADIIVDNDDTPENLAQKIKALILNA